MFYAFFEQTKQIYSNVPEKLFEKVQPPSRFCEHIKYQYFVLSPNLKTHSLFLNIL